MKKKDILKSIAATGVMLGGANMMQRRVRSRVGAAGAGRGEQGR